MNEPQPQPFILVNLHRRLGWEFILLGLVESLLTAPAIIVYESLSPLAAEHWWWLKMVGVAPILGVFFAIGGLVGLSKARRTDKDFAAYRSGEYLAHWTFPADEWERHVAGLPSPAKSMKLAFWILSGLGFLTAILGLAFRGDFRHLDNATMNIVLAYPVIGAILGVLVAAGIKLHDAARRKSLLRNGRDVIIAQHSAYFCGAVAAWGVVELDRQVTVLHRTGLTDAHYDPTTRCIHLDIVWQAFGKNDKSKRAAFGVALFVLFGPEGRHLVRDQKMPMGVFVPAGHDEEAQRVVELILAGPRWRPQDGVDPFTGEFESRTTLSTLKSLITGDLSAAPPSHLQYHRKVLRMTLGAGTFMAIVGGIGAGFIKLKETDISQPAAILLAALVMFVAWCFGGFSIACMLAPAEFLDGPIGQKWMRIIGVRSIRMARVVCFILALVVAAFTAAPVALTLWGPDRR